jgi:rare lipoprotein A
VPGDVVALAGNWLQLGAFRQREGAAALRDRVQRTAAAQAPGLVPMLRLSDEAGTVRLHAGPYGGRAEALAAAARLRELLGIDALPVELR